MVSITSMPAQGGPLRSALCYRQGPRLLVLEVLGPCLRYRRKGLHSLRKPVKKVVGDQSRSGRHTLLRFFLIFLCCFLSFLLGLLLRIREVVCEELDKNGMRLLQGSLTRLRSSSSKFGIVVDFNVNLANVRIEYIKSEHGRGKCVHGLLLLRI